MASMQSSPSTTEGGDVEKIEALKIALYDRVTDVSGEGRLWSQQDLLDLDIIPNNNITYLMLVVQKLCNERLFRLVEGNNGVCYRWRSEEDAKMYNQLSYDDRLVYERIDDAGSDGIWSRTLKARLRMHESVLKQSIKRLEARGYIRDMKSVENPNKKMYIKASLRPSDKATGGPWYTDSKLDEAFIDMLQEVIYVFVRNQSSYKSTHGGGGGQGGSDSSSMKQPKKGVLKGGENHRVKKRPADAISTTTAGDDEAAAAAAAPSNSHHQQQHHRRKSQRKEVLLPLPAGYKEYPTVREIATWLEGTDIVRNTILGHADIQQLIDVLVHDRLLEPVRVPSNGGGGHEPQYGYRVCNIARIDTEGEARRRRLREEEEARQRERELADSDGEDSGGDGRGAGGAGGGGGAPGGAAGRGLGAAGKAATVGAAAAANFIGPPPMKNGLTDVPCGHCPQFDLCEVGGPVSPTNCVYFTKWLELEDMPELD